MEILTRGSKNMTSELLTQDYIIALIESSKKATEMLKEEKIRRILENEDTTHKLSLFDDILKYFGSKEFDYEIRKATYKTRAMSAHLGDDGILQAYVKMIVYLTGKKDYDNEDIYLLLKDIASNADKYIKPKNFYLLKPVLDIMQSFIEKCEKLEKEQPTSLLENSINPTIDKCKELKAIFSDFIQKYETTKKDTPFYKRWYYWFMSLPRWKKILIGFLFVGVLFIILLVVLKVGRKVVAALKRAANGDRAVGRKLVYIASNANPRVKAAAFSASMYAITRRAALYF